MLNDENKMLCGKVLKKYGFAHQLLKTGEECTELSQVIFRITQGETNLEKICNLFEEFVDVYVMEEQLLQYFVEYIGMDVGAFNASAKIKLLKALEGDKNEVN